MGTDAIGFTLALLAMGLSLVAARSRNLLLSLGAAGLWSALMAFFLANTTAGLAWQVIFVLSSIAFIMAMLFLGVGRGTATRSEGEQPASPSIIRNIIRQFRGSSYEPPTRGETTAEYRDKVRKALNKGGTRKKR